MNTTTYKTPKNNSRFYFGAKVFAKWNKCLDKEVFRQVWNNFCYTACTVEGEHTEGYVFKIGEVNILDTENYTFSINVTPDGVAVAAKDEKGLIDGFYALLEHIEVESTNPGEERLYIPCMEKIGKSSIKNRMIHYCVFPETKEFEIERFIKLCGALRYTHIVIEFWGMLKYDCLKELAWEFAYSKEQIRSLISLANDLGMQVVPMFNHWGHASQGRVATGKHVVLDQNPKLATLFDECGWSWDIRKKEVRELHARVREELIELCGDGEYFHIGCDEAYGYENDPEACAVLAEYANEVSAELAKSGKRTIMWGDMLLLEDRHNKGQEFYTANRKFHVCSCCDAKTEQMLINNISKDIIIADWQYWRGVYPVKTSIFFKEKGFDVMTCSWDISTDNICACCDTVKNNNLFGFMHTTWHTLKNGMPDVVTAALASGRENFDYESCKTIIKPATASLIRKVYPSNGDYLKTGWSENQIN